MPGNDDRSRPTRPPLAREEDPPPAQYRDRASRVPAEPIAKIALRAPKATTLDPHEAVMQALAATEGRMLTELSSREEERQRAFEERLKQELSALVVREVRSVPPPATKKPFDWSQLQYVAALVVALTGLVAVILNGQKPNAEVLKRLDEIGAAQLKGDKKLDAHAETETAQRSSDRQQGYRYALDVRSWVTDVLERAASVKIDDPPGTPPRDQLRFYPPPRIDPHKVTDTHIVQPRDPYPVPPPP